MVVGCCFALHNGGFKWQAHVLGILATAVVLWGTLRPNSGLFGPIETQPLLKSNAVWLTIDDGPEPETTPVLLDLLDRADSKATFFVIGERAQAHPDLITEILNRGHQIGNHSHSHPQATFWIAGPYRTWREINKCESVLNELRERVPPNKPTPHWFRAPVGHSNLFTAPVLRALGLRQAGWTCRGYDAASTKSSDQVVAAIASDLEAEGTILIHDATDIAPDVLRAVIDLVESRQLRFELPLGKV